MSAARRSALLLGAALLALAASGVVASIPVAEDEFPHARHRGLFPLCSGCHVGIEEGGNPNSWYPEPETCLSCHDGVRGDSVQWSAPTRVASNLAFVHAEHAGAVARAGDSAATCQSCHRDPAGNFRMSVGRATPEACLSCHAHDADEHLADGRDCASCHVPLTAATGLSEERVEAIERPASHERPDFLRAHAPASDLELASCATCHARESCERCHFNGRSLPAVSALGPDERVADLVAATPPEYPRPVSHDDPSWAWVHGAVATDAPATCANCHTRPSCETCHAGAPPSAITGLPTLASDDVRGIQVSERVSMVHPAGYAKEHGAPAATSESTCASCHAESTCASCHAGAASPGFHVGNFLQSHGPEAYGNEVDCASCHNTEVFCRSCHAEVGLAAVGRAGTAFHDARPLWLLGHGIAARQGLESCVTCHSQSYCMRCHAAVGSWRINPHGPDFDPVRAQDSPSKATCVLCHRTGVPPR